MAGKTENRKIYISINGKEVEHSYGGIRKEVNRLSRELDKLTPGTKEFTDKKRDLDQVKKKFDEVATATGRTNRGLKQSSNLLGGMKGLVAGVFTIGALTSFIRKMVSVRGEFERFRAVLTNLLGDDQEAASTMQMIQKFAAETPFSVRELTDAYVRLANQGFKPTRTELQKLADIAAASGKQMSQLSEAIVDAQVGEFERLKEFGIRAEKDGDRVRFTFRGITEEVDFTSQAIQKYLVGLGEVEGVTGSTAAISETLEGRISNLGDAYDQLLITLGGQSSGVFYNIINWSSEFLNNLNMAFKTLEQIKEQVAKDLGTEQMQRDREEADALAKKYESIFPALSNLQVKLKAIHDIQAQYETQLDQWLTDDERARLEERVANLQKYSELVQRQYEQELNTKRQLSDKEQKRLEKERQDRLNAFNDQYGEKETKRILDLAESSLTQIYEQERAILMEQRAQNKIDKEEYDNEMLILEIAHLEAIKEARREIGEDTLAIEQRILSIKIKIREDEAAAEEELTKKKADEADKQREVEEKRKQLMLESAATSGMAAVEYANTVEEAARGVLNSIRNQVKAYLAEAVAASVAKALASVPFPINIALATAAGGAATALFNAIVPSFAEGGFTGSGSGQPDGTGYKRAGYVHEDEWVAPRWMKQSPMYASTINSLEYARANNIGRYGGASKTINNNSTVNNTVVSETMELAVAELRATIREMREKGLPVIASDRFYRDMKEVEDLHNAITDKTQF